jgi:2-octaprenyl-6-methoxyphenol hydroxylase
MDRSLHTRVIGAGPTGSLAALALAAAGWSAHLHDPLGAAQLCRRSRAYAFTHSSRSLLERLDLWGDLEPVLVPFRTLHLVDLWLERAVDFGPEDLGPAAEAATEPPPVGWIGLHGPLMERLLERLRRHPAIMVQLGEPPAWERQPPPDLIVAADGPGSPTREALGIGQWGWDYDQSCLTAQVELRGAGPATAWELLRPEGPFAVLPLGDRLHQLVWSAGPGRCRQLESLDPAAFLDALAGALPDRLQPDALHDHPRAFPVALRLARRLRHGRTVLVGESAHRCHPVGGQGLNLCWRDVAVLHGLALRAAQGRLAPRRIPAAYALRRWPDLLLTLAATDLIVRLHSNRLPLLWPLRRLAMALLASQPRLRRWILGVMTRGACPPLPQAPA